MKTIKIIIIIKIIAIVLIFLMEGNILLCKRESYFLHTTKASLRGVQSSLELYYKHNKNYPKDLRLLIKEGYLSENANKDQWDNEYFYCINGKDGYFLICKGPDNKIITKDDILPPINTKGHLPKGYDIEQVNESSIDSSSIIKRIIGFLEAILYLGIFLAFPFDISYFVTRRKHAVNKKMFYIWNGISFILSFIIYLELFLLSFRFF